MRWKLVIASVGLICLVIALALWGGNSSKRTLPDGTTLVLSGVMIGPTNIYMHGTFWSKIIGRFVPAKGFAVAGFKLQRPEKITFTGQEGSEILSARLELLPRSPREKSLVSPPFFRKYRLLIYGEQDFAFVEEFRGFKRQADGLVSYVLAPSFPRDSRQLHFRLEERDTPESRDWREVAIFVVRNPKRAAIKPWQAQKAPRLKLAEGLEVEIGELTVRRERIHPNDIWEYMGLLPVRVIRNGEAVTNWGIHSGSIMWDASGNLEYFSSSKVITNDWMVHQLFRPLDPAKTWRFRANFALDSGFPQTNLFSFIVPWPLQGTIQTNLGGLPARIRFVNGDMLDVELVSQPADKRLTFISAFDGTGANLVRWVHGSWGQHSFWRGLELSKPTEVHATVAIHRNYQAEFTLQPRYEKPSGHVEAKGAQSPR